MPKKPNEVDAYISGFPNEVQKRLQEIRKTIKKAAPEAEESISYAIPAYTLHGPLVYFAAFKNHIGFYPVPSGMKAFEKELAAFHSSKATVQFSHDEPIPFELVTKIVKFRMQENLSKVAEKSRGNILEGLSAPARRALEEKGIKTVLQLARHSKTEILSLHGVGPASLPKLEKALAAAGKKFKKE